MITDGQSDKPLTDSELREFVDEYPVEALFNVAINSLRMTATRRFKPSEREVSRYCCLIALFCIERLLGLPELPNVGPIKAAE